MQLFVFKVISRVSRVLCSGLAEYGLLHLQQTNRASAGGNSPALVKDCGQTYHVDSV